MSSEWNDFFFFLLRNLGEKKIFFNVPSHANYTQWKNKGRKGARCIRGQSVVSLFLRKQTRMLQRVRSSISDTLPMLIHLPFLLAHPIVVSPRGNKNNKTQSILANSPLSYFLRTPTFFYCLLVLPLRLISSSLIHILFIYPLVLFLSTTTPFSFTLIGLHNIAFFINCSK